MNETPTIKKYNPDADEDIIEEEKSKIEFTEPPKRGYLGFLRFFAGLNGLIAFLGVLIFIFSLAAEMNRSSYQSPNLFWILGLAMTVQGLVAYGTLNAIADIAENMIDVGTYVRDLRRHQKE